MKIDKFIEKEKIIFDREIKKVFSSIKPKSKLHNVMWYSINNGGKRIRPILLKEFSHKLGVTKKDYFSSMIAIELIHSYSLVHDDLPSMDNDDYRRGKLATHKKFDEGQAILAGNSLLTLAFEIISSSNNHQVISSLAELAGMKGLAGGQSLDLLLNSKKLTKKNILGIHELKTACLFEFCASTPFILSNSNAKKIRDARKFGKLFGKVFQIMDDIADEDELNKTSINILNNVTKQKAISLANKYCDEATEILHRLLPNYKKIELLLKYLILVK